jgi:hypothetical protein
MAKKYTYCSIFLRVDCKYAINYIKEICQKYVVTLELRHLSYRGISFCVSVLEKSAVCELSEVLKPSINSSLQLKRCDRNLFFT